MVRAAILLSLFFRSVWVRPVFCFTKLLRPLVKRWRSMGHLSFVYLDDGLGSQPDRISASAASIIQRNDLKASGLLSNEDKSHWSPTQIGEWLGFVVNSKVRKFFLPEKKMNKLKSPLRSAISQRCCTYRFLAKIAGTIASCALAVGPVARLLSRQMYFTLASRLSWAYVVQFTPALLHELQFWFDHIACFNGYPINSAPTSTAILFSDANDLAFGGYAATLNNSQVSGMFTDQDIGKSSPFRELKAMYYGCLSYADQLRCQRVKIFSANQAAVRIVSVGSSIFRTAADRFRTVSCLSYL